MMPEPRRHTADARGAHIPVCVGGKEAGSGRIYANIMSYKGVCVCVRACAC